jgi:ribosome-associated protein
MAKSPTQISLSQQSRKRAAPVPDPARDQARKESRAEEGSAPRMARLAADAALDKKAEDVRLIDLRGLGSYADFLVVCSGSSDRQLTAIADSAEKALKDAGQRPVGSEGYSGGRWVLLDFGDVVIHVFHQEERASYDLEGLWADAPQTVIEPKAPAAT